MRRRPRSSSPRPEQSERRDCRFPRDLWRRLCGEADRHLCPRALWRRFWPQSLPPRLPVSHGPVDDGGRPRADPCARRRLGRRLCSWCRALSRACGRGRNLRRKLHDPRARALRTTRLFRQLHFAGRAGRPNSRGGCLSAVELRAVKRSVPVVGLAHSISARRWFSSSGIIIRREVEETRAFREKQARHTTPTAPVREVLTHHPSLPISSASRAWRS